MMQYGIYINQNRCTGCFACVVACKDWHDVPAGPASWIRVKTIEKGRYPDLFVAFLPVLCNHCLKPACVSVCPADALTKRIRDGIVTVDGEKCLGKEVCGLCLDACPYDAPQFGAEEDAKMQKCDLCIDRQADGKQPICVSSCPMQAIDSGPLDELRAKYGDYREAEGFRYNEKLVPSIAFTPKKDGRNLAPRLIRVTPEMGSGKASVKEEP
jgi:anaerobic dimethyl sulfoxide reductase subunit B (iron-sulfur subunit)